MESGRRREEREERGRYDKCLLSPSGWRESAFVVGESRAVTGVGVK
jgi:hypothetical protein